jgi:membrane protein
VLGPALFVAAGLEILKTIGRVYLRRAEANPAYQVVTVAVAVLIFLSLLNQFILFAAALTATSTRGTVTDLAAGPSPPAVHHPTSAAGAGSRLGRSVRGRRMLGHRKAVSACRTRPPRRWQ